MKIKRFIGGLYQSNGYVIYQREGGDCFVIDPGYKHMNFLDFIKENKLNLRGILLTHHHHDHVGAVKKIVDETGCPVYLHRLDADRFAEPVTLLEDGDVFDLSGEEIRVIHTPGHTEGGVCYFSEKSKLAFTGDTIFNVDLGRTDLDDGDPAKMEATMRDIIDKWSNEITIYPGHGDHCTMKYVRQVNREFLDIVGELK
ncbi:MAG: MBL fold metallo-hydrolase [Anaerovoracaceae bacterium]|jgi:hydroxyacylglutathione hydrolase